MRHRGLLHERHRRRGQTLHAIRQNGGGNRRRLKSTRPAMPSSEEGGCRLTLVELQQFESAPRAPALLFGEAVVCITLIFR